MVERTLAATPEILIERGVIPSAEVLAELVPRIAATTVAAGYRDERLRSVMAADYEAFRNRRSLLLLDLERQVRGEELPWVQAVRPFKAESDEASAEARAALVRLTELAIDVVQRQRDGAAPTSPAFDAYCVARAGGPAKGWSVAANGTVIEQAQILTTHNLATLTGPFGVGEQIEIEWASVARKSFGRALVPADRLRANPRPLRPVEDLVYAWRQ